MTTLKQKIQNHLFEGKALSSQYVTKVWKGQPGALTKNVYTLRKKGVPIELSKGTGNDNPNRYRICDEFFKLPQETRFKFKI